jgi:hypothetical protein
MTVVSLNKDLFIDTAYLFSGMKENFAAKSPLFLKWLTILCEHFAVLFLLREVVVIYVYLQLGESK